MNNSVRDLTGNKEMKVGIMHVLHTYNTYIHAVQVLA